MTPHRFIRRIINHRSARVTVSIPSYRRPIGRGKNFAKVYPPDRGAEITEDRHGTPAGFFPWLDSFYRSVFPSAGTRDSRVNSRRAQRVSSRADLALTRLRLSRITLLESRNPRFSSATTGERNTRDGRLSGYLDRGREPMHRYLETELPRPPSFILRRGGRCTHLDVPFNNARTHRPLNLAECGN